MRKWRSQINWTKVGERIPDNSGHFYHESPCSPYVPCLVFACYPGKPQGGVIEIIRYDTKNNQWYSVDIDAHWTLQHPYEITHFCDDKLNYPDDPDFLDEYEQGSIDTADYYSQMYDPDY